MASAASGTTIGLGGRAHASVVLIIDDHPLFCEALSVTLRSALDVDKIEVVATLADALEWLRQRPAPDLVLFDLMLPDVDGLGGLIELKKVAAGVPIIVVSALSEDRVITSVVQAGASGFIPKQSPRSAFIQAIERIWAGDVYTPEGYAPPGPGGHSALEEHEAVELMESLTPQQARILRLVGAGKLNKQIAYELDISEATVKAHLTAILRKFNVQSRMQAVLIAQNARFAAILHKMGDLS